MNLHDNNSLFEEIIAATANYLKINELFIEKDYWITFILKHLSLSNFKDRVVFKGGTSLSKGFQIIDRLSEDIDLALLEIESFSDNQVKNLIKKIEKAVVENPLYEIKEHPQISKHSRIRKTVYKFPTIFKESVFPSIIILEINSFAIPKPFIKQKIASLIYEFLKKQDENLIKKYNLSPFELNILSYNRTFCEKISAVARASFSGESVLKNKIRHLYDIYKLMELTDIKEFINTSEFANMLKIVKIDDLKQKSFDEDWKNKNYSEAPIFSNIEKLENIFNKQLSSLIIGDLPDFSNVSKSFNELRNILKNIGI